MEYEFIVGAGEYSFTVWTESYAWRSVPGPLSAALVTSRVLTWGVGVGGNWVGVGRTKVRVGSTVVAVGSVSVGVGLGAQADSPSTATIPRAKKVFIISRYVRLRTYPKIERS